MSELYNLIIIIMLMNNSSRWRTELLPIKYDAGFSAIITLFFSITMLSLAI